MKSEPTKPQVPALNPNKAEPQTRFLLLSTSVHPQPCCVAPRVLCNFRVLYKISLWVFSFLKAVAEGIWQSQ